MNTLHRKFDELGGALRQLISLLEENDEQFWIAYLRRGLHQVEAHKLAGATFVLGCYGGQETFSDIVIARDWESSDPMRFRNANARLGELRTRTFEAAKVIASREYW